MWQGTRMIGGGGSRGAIAGATNAVARLRIVLLGDHRLSFLSSSGSSNNSRRWTSSTSHTTSPPPTASVTIIYEPPPLSTHRQHEQQQRQSSFASVGGAVSGDGVFIGSGQPPLSVSAAVVDNDEANTGIGTKPTFKDVMELSKFRLSALVVATSSAGFLAAGAPAASTSTTLAMCCLGTALCSSSASTWNQILEIDRDRRMKRTRHRPLVKESVTREQAIGLATLTGMGGASTLYVGTDMVTTALGVGNIALYAGLYTYMKPRSELNTWVGAVVGAIPPVMGWTAAGGSVTDPEALLLGSMLYLWQMPHFFALAYMHRVDYARGQFQMVPVNESVDTTNYDRTSSIIKRYTWYLSTIPIAAYALDVTSSMFPLEGLLLNGYALHKAYQFDQDRSNANARQVFMTSLWYLPCLMTLFILHSKTWDQKERERPISEDWLLKTYQEFVQALRQKGRDLCVHEVVTHGDHCMVFVNDQELLLRGEDKCPFTSKGRAHAFDKTRDFLKEQHTGATATNTSNVRRSGTI